MPRDLIGSEALLIALGRDPRHVLEKVAPYRAHILADVGLQHLDLLGGYLNGRSEHDARVEVVEHPVGYPDGGLRRVAHPIVGRCAEIILQRFAQALQYLEALGVVADGRVSHRPGVCLDYLALSCHLLAFDLAGARGVASVDRGSHWGFPPCASAMWCMTRSIISSRSLALSYSPALGCFPHISAISSTDRRNSGSVGSREVMTWRS